jgi:PucR C-terminal helix-turn-helix domain/GGDEF-like domain
MAAQPTLLESVGSRFLDDREALADEMVDRIRAGVTDFGEFDGPELWEAMRASCLANLEAGLTGLTRQLELPDEIPPDARDLALLAARLDVPLAAVLGAYRIGHAMIWQRWFEAVEREATDGEARRAALEAASTYLFEYVNRLSNFVTAEYTAERDRFMRSREQRRTQLVRDILDGEDPDPAVAMRELDYDLRLHHFAVVVSGADVEGVVRTLGRTLEAPHRLIVSLAGETAWAWLGRTREFAIPERVEVPDGVALSVGDPAAGTEGFRRSHREAREAHRIALRGGGDARVVRYDQVALESLVADDEGRIRDFVSRELRGIDGDDARSHRLRETLRAYFACAQNASAAAAMLGVHEHTVTYRLRTIEERLGRPVTARRAELETALRLLETVRQTDPSA